jgi:hypothetical protein
MTPDELTPTTTSSRQGPAGRSWSASVTWPKSHGLYGDSRCIRSAAISVGTVTPNDCGCGSAPGSPVSVHIATFRGAARLVNP